MTGWRWVLVAWTLAVGLLVATQSWGVLAFVLVWIIGVAVIGGVRMGVQR